MKAALTNANPHAVTLRVQLGAAGPARGRLDGTRVKDGQAVYEVSVPANGKPEVASTVRQANSGR